MDSEYVPIRELVDVGEDYEEFIKDLEGRIDKRDVPNWLLIPKRKSGEHATGGAWLGIVMSVCTGDGDGQIEARIAVDVEDRGRMMSSVSDVPSVIETYIAEATNKIENEVEMCVARMNYNKEELELEDIEIFLKTVIEDDEENNGVDNEADDE